LAGRFNLTVENYTERLEGLFIPPYNATYQFYIGGDDWCDLWLSNDSSPANAVRIAMPSGHNLFSTPFWQFPSQRSPELALVAGEPYYIRISHEEYTGFDWVRVALRIINPPPHGS
jgi:endoglucanase